MIREVLKYPDPLLREVAKPVAEVTRETELLVRDMIETMQASLALGLAAPQVGVSLRIFVAATPNGPLVFINPEILEKEGEVTYPEGCLSFPDRIVDVPRAARVVVRAQNTRGRFAVEASGLAAVVMQHEIDHLDGVLMTDAIQGALPAVAEPSGTP